MQPLERQFMNEAIDKGFVVYRNGWPDFMIEQGELIQAVEVKSANDYLSDEQMRVMNLLGNAGIEGWVYRGEWVDPDIVQTESAEKNRILEDLIRMHLEKIMDALAHLDLLIPLAEHCLVDRGCSRDKFVKTAKKIKKILHKPPPSKYLRLVQKWNRLFSQNRA